MTLVEIVSYLMAPVGGLALGLAVFWMARREQRKTHPGE